MARRVIVVEPAVVQRHIADAILGADNCGAELGRVHLRPHQREAVTRIRRAIAEFGGALLADSVGLGKTYVALAVARDYERITVVGPAVLRSTWTRAAQEAGVAIEYRTMESLSRRAAQPAAHGIVIVDEAHHFRSPGTRRYESLAQLTAGTPVLLLSATPVHNTPHDLTALLALFLGSEAGSISDAAIAMCVIRRESRDLAQQILLPRLGASRAIRRRGDSRVVAMLRALPAPLPPKDGGIAAELIARSLVHQWASSDAALCAAIRRRLGVSRALSQALEAGKIPSRRELASWTLTQDAVQLGFAELLVEGAALDASGALSAVEAHADGLRGVLAHVQRDKGRDESLAEQLRVIRKRHSAQKIVAFSQYAATVETLFRTLRGDGRVAALSGTRAQIASGRISRDEAIRLFRDANAPARARIDLLLTTDILSEGVNLPEATVIVHIDLPWTAARLEQRVGRARRLGSQAKSVTVYTFLPPITADHFLRTSAILETKTVAAARTIGQLETDHACRREHMASPARTEESLRSLLVKWRTAGGSTDDRSSFDQSRTLVAATRAEANGFVAALRDVGEPFLLASVSLNASASDDPATVHAAVSAARNGRIACSARAYLRARRAIAAWLANRELTNLVRPSPACSIHAALTARLNQVVGRAALSARPSAAVRASTLRAKLLRLRGAGIERTLRNLLATCNDGNLITRLECLARQYSHNRPTDSTPRHADDPHLVAVLLLRRK